jgi:prevent-host-death family protein
VAETIGMFAAKTRFSELVERVQSTGQAVTITNRGRPAVEIVPCRDQSTTRLSRAEAFLEIARLRDELPPISTDEIKELIAEGRR